MIVEKDKIIEAKNKLGTDAAFIIAEELNLQQFDEKNLKAICPFHKEDTPSFVWNQKNHSFKCFGCGVNYGIIDHYIEHHNLTFLNATEKLFEKVGIKHAFGTRGVKTEREYKYPQYKQNDDRSIVERYFALRKISKETLDYCDVQQTDNNLVAWNFYDANDVLMTVKLRHPRKPLKKESKEWYLPDYDNAPILYNMNKIDPTQPLLITEGQCDCLSAIESGYKNAVSIPGGTENLKFIERCFDWLEQFEQIILWFDNDAPGIKARKEVASRLGAWRVLYVELPLELTDNSGATRRVKDANEVLYYTNTQTVLDFINNAQEIPIQGVVNLAEVEDFDLEKAEGLYSGLKDVDNIIYKFLFGSVAIITGKRGSGKSSLLNQMFITEALNQGHDIFCYSGELDARVLKSWIEINMAGSEKITMKNKFVHVIDKDTSQQIKSWYNNRIWVYDENTNDYKTVLNKAITTTKKYGTKVWVLDNLMTLDIGAKESDVYQKQKDFIVELVSTAALYNVLILLVIHPRKTNIAQTSLTGDDISGSGDLGNMAQYIMSVHRYTEDEKKGEPDTRNGGYKKGKEPIAFDVRLDILKNRYTGKLGSANLHFSYPDYRFYATAQELYKRLKWNNDTSPIPTKIPKQINSAEAEVPDFME